jgi:uncharacterized glyoxalase superfamily protein PhnB
MQQIIAELTVQDIPTSMEWYKALGFSVELTGIQDEQGLQWVSMGREGRAVWLLREDISRHEAGSGSSVTFYLQVDDVDRLYNVLVDQGIQPDTRPQNQWYGLRDFVARDPDGFCWAINQSISPDECPPHPKLGYRVRLL